jgi:hypothetical protein
MSNGGCMFLDRTDSAGDLLDFVKRDYMIYQPYASHWDSVCFVVCIDL